MEIPTQQHLKKKKPYLLQAYKTLGKIGNIIPQQIHTNTHYRISQKSTDYEKKYREKYNSDVGTNSLGYIITGSF